MFDGLMIDRGDGTRLAFAKREGRGPAILFLPGYMSDMTGSKALAIDAWAAATGRAAIRFDYSGCGASEGDFATATLTRWRDDALAVIDSHIEGPVVLVGSSMGGWIMLLAALARPARVTALVGIAAAPDFTDWGFTEAQKMAILSRGRLEQPSDYAPEPTVTTRAFWQSGQAHRLLEGEIAIDCPVRLLHGQRDPDVPWHHALRLAERLRSADVQTLLVKDGDHRLSRDSDIALLLATIQALPL
jgi:pimeloyl-ACP methyl ester carboxylesterase